MSESQIRVRNMDIICVLEIALDICSRLVHYNKEWNTEFVYFKLPSEIEYHSTDGQFVPTLLQCIYLSIPSKAERQNTPQSSVEITLLITDAEKTRTESLKIKDTKIKSIRYDELHIEHDTNLKKLLKSIDESFLSQEKLDSLKEVLFCFLERRQQLAQCNSPFPDYGIMDSYLQCYYELLTFVLLNEELIKTLRADMLHMLLQLDSDAHSISLLSPIAMNRLRRMYIGIEKYYHKLLKADEENVTLELFYQNVIKQKTLQSFRWFMNGDNGELEHAAVSAYANGETNELRDLDLKVMRIDIHEYNSYEGIGELRIAEKILYEMEKCFEKLENHSPEQFHVAILGDVSRERMNELDDYLNGVLKAQRGNYRPKLIFDIYTKNDVGKESCDTEIEMNYHSSLDEIFTSRDQLSNLLQEHEVIFMMDCTKLYYEMEYIPEMSSGYLKQQFAFGNALDNATENKIDICCPNLLDKLYSLMTVYDRRGELGVFSKRSNDVLLKFCEDQVHLTQDQYHTLYVYVSDLIAFNNIYCNDKYYMRTERYNQKEIGIIRYTNNESEQLHFPISSGNKEKMLCFNVWQIVKHISLEKRGDIIKKILEEISCANEETIKDYDLHCMHIGVDYSNWPKRLELHYAVIDDKTLQVRENAKLPELFLKTFAEKVILPIFNQPRDELFQKYIWKTIYSLLYGAAKNVEEMVLIYLLQNKSEIMGRTVMTDKNNMGDVVNNINRVYKYSIKRFVAMIILRFDISELGAIDQMWAAYIINKSDKAANREEKLFYKVREACKKIGYTDSYLYRNCMNIE